MTQKIFLLVILVSCAHAMVHVYEMSLGSVEVQLTEELEKNEEKAKELSGQFSMVWRLTFGVGALFAGWLADRFGSKPMLIIYLLGCAATCVLVWWAPNIGVMFGAMFIMGSFASIYHPVGLAIISRETTPETRSAALGWHGIFGSVGIAAAPFIAGAMISKDGFDWRDYYLVLTIPGVILALLLWKVLQENRDNLLQKKTEPKRIIEGDKKLLLGPFLLLVSVGGVSGFIYGGMMHFLTRYFKETELVFGSIDSKERAPIFTAIVLICGAVGQGIAGKLAAPKRLRLMYCLIIFSNAPCLIWLANVDGVERLIAACVMALVHFMNQPVYNSIISHYVPVQRRSLGYGYSSMFCFGMGGFGAMLGGMIPSLETFFYILSGVAIIGGMLAAFLCYWPAAKWDGD